MLSTFLPEPVQVGLQNMALDNWAWNQRKQYCDKPLQQPLIVNSVWILDHSGTTPTHPSTHPSTSRSDFTIHLSWSSSYLSLGMTRFTMTLKSKWETTIASFVSRVPKKFFSSFPVYGSFSSVAYYPVTHSGHDSVCAWLKKALSYICTCSYFLAFFLKRDKPNGDLFPDIWCDVITLIWTFCDRHSHSEIYEAYLNECIFKHRK